MSYASTILADTPSLYLQLNETSGSVATDSSTNALNGTYTNCLLNQNGYYQLGQSVSFNGTTSNISVPNNSLLHPTIGSLEAWFNISVHGTIAGITTDFLLLVNSSNQLSATVDISGTIFTALYSTALLTGTWYHAVATYDGITLKLYLNAQLVASTIASGTILNSSTTFTIAANTFSGNIQQVALYNSALTTTQIANHYFAAFPPAVLPGYVTQIITETILIPECKSRISQMVVEILSHPSCEGRVSQIIEESIFNISGYTNVAQVIIETILDNPTSITLPTSGALVTQLVAEVLRNA